MIRIIILSVLIFSLCTLLATLKGNDAFWFCLFVMCVGVLFIDSEKGGV